MLVGETSFQLTVGAEQGKEISKTSTVGRSLTAMVGLETSVSGGASVPLLADGEVSVTARVEVTGELSEEYQDAIVDSFTSKRESTNAVTCAGAGVMWQWKSNLRIERLSRVEDVAANSLLTVCAPVGVKPPHGNDIAWDPALAGKFPLAAGAQFERGGEKVSNASGNDFAVLLADGNLIVNTTDGRHLWGLNEVMLLDKMVQAAQVTFQTDGNLVARSASGGYLWSALHAAQPKGATLRLTDGGVLQIVLPNKQVVWSSR